MFRSFRLAACAIIGAAILSLSATALSAELAHAERLPRAVSLSDATHAPRSAFFVFPGETIIGKVQCPRGHFWTETSAYRWDGSALSAQRWNRLHDRTFWRDSRGGRVIFDGVAVHNGTRAPIIFAGWCS